MAIEVAAEAAEATSAQPKIRKPRGILNPKSAASAFEIRRIQPALDLSSLVEHYWIVRWDRRGLEPYTQDVLIFPCVNLVFEPGLAAVHGPRTARYSRLLVGQGQALGIKFRPAGFYPFVRSPVSRFTNRSVNVETVFGVSVDELRDDILAQDDVDTMVSLTEGFLRDLHPQQDDDIADNIATIHHIIDCIIDDRAISKVDDMLSRFDISKRTLQRLFSRYVGVSPKWVIQRYRLHEAADHLQSGEAVDLSKLALDLGYFDQAHFIKDFKAIVGKTPAEYAKGDDDPTP